MEGLGAAARRFVDGPRRDGRSRSDGEEGAARSEEGAAGGLQMLCEWTSEWVRSD